MSNVDKFVTNKYPNVYHAATLSSVRFAALVPLSQLSYFDAKEQWILVAFTEIWPVED